MEVTASDSHTPKKDRKRELAIGALLVAPTIAAAAETAGLSEATLLRWLREQTFAAEYRAARREAVQQATAQLQRACSTAVQTLVDIAEDATAKEGARVTAARSILEYSLRAVELEDLAARIERLEQMQAAMEGRP